tara:strand:- start:220 stop:645 length:426 start_codon:yes stop_codon:yes gene_type:complete
MNIELKKLDLPDNILVRCIRIWIRCLDENRDPLPLIYVVLTSNGIKSCEYLINAMLSYIILSDNKEHDFNLLHNGYLTKSEFNILTIMSQIQIKDYSSVDYQLNKLIDNIYKEKFLINIKYICNKFSQAGLFFEERNYAII